MTVMKEGSFCLQQTLVIFLVVLAAFSPAALAAGVSVEAGAVSACPAGCSCMPESQAARLGYVPCSAGQNPCFHDSFGQPLYCFGKVAGSCGSGCNTTPNQLQQQPGIRSTDDTGTILPVPVLANSTLAGTPNPKTTLPEPDLFTQIAGFFRSLLGMT